MTDQPKYQRRKEDRPQEIADAAFAAFAEKGYAATRIDDVARARSEGGFDAPGVLVKYDLEKGTSEQHDFGATVQPGEFVFAESVTLRVTAEDRCGNVGVSEFDPAVEPSVLGDEVLADGTVCPAIAQPEPPKCKGPVCR